MSQPRAMSFVEAATNVAVGYGIALATQVVVYPAVGLAAHPRQMLLIGLAFTAVSLARSYVLRRVFDRWSARGL